MKKICISTISIGLNDNDRYWKTAENLIKTNLKHTNYDIVLITNNVGYFNSINEDRLKVFNYDDLYKENKISDKRFNMHLKRYPIKLSSELGYDIIFYNDCDCYIDGWEHESFLKKCNEDFDVAFVSHANPQLGGLRKKYKHREF